MTDKPVKNVAHSVRQRLINEAKIHWYAQDDEEFARKTEADDWDLVWFEHGYQHFPIDGMQQIFEGGVIRKLKKPCRAIPAELVQPSGNQRRYRGEGQYRPTLVRPQ